MDKLLEIKDLDSGVVYWIALELKEDHPEFLDMSSEEWSDMARELALDRFRELRPDVQNNYEVLGVIMDPIMQLKRYEGYVIYYEENELGGYHCYVYKENQEENLLDEFDVLKNHITPYGRGRNLKSAIQDYMDGYIKFIKESELCLQGQE